jgi:dolichol kinase
VSQSSEAVATAEPPVLTYGAELRRKALHFTALGYPIGILLVDPPLSLVILWAMAALAVGLDVARQRVPAVKRVMLDVVGSIMRPEEIPPAGGPLVFNGAVWMCIAAAVCATLFPAPIAAAALIMQQMGDAAAAVVGRRYGQVRWPGQQKTLEGSLALAVVGFVSAWLLSQLPVPGVEPALPIGRLALGAFAAAAAEALPIPPNDNIRVPLLAGAVMLLMG